MATQINIHNHEPLKPVINSYDTFVTLTVNSGEGNTVTFFIHDLENAENLLLGARELLTATAEMVAREMVARNRVELDSDRTWTETDQGDWQEVEF